MPETETEVLVGQTFRRNSLVSHGVEGIPIERIEGILGQIGQSYDSKKLKKRLIELQDSHHKLLDLASYMTLCKEFVTCPAAAAKLEGDDFAFKNLIKLEDFEHM